jgi:hypothetical protein
LRTEGKKGSVCDRGAVYCICSAAEGKSYEQHEEGADSMRKERTA